MGRRSLIIAVLWGIGPGACVPGSLLHAAPGALDTPGPTTWHVDANVCPGTGSGTPDDPFCAIAIAIGAAADAGDTILVAPGTYAEVISLDGKAVHLRARDGADVTVIDAQGLDASAVQCVQGEGPATIVEGFTLTGGVGSPAPGAGDTRYGGGLLVVASAPTVRDCVLRENVAGRGGGMAIVDGGDPSVSGCRFVANQAGDGGGLYTEAASVTVEACVFTENTAFTGGGLASVDATATVRRSLLEGNQASFGGAVNNNGASLTLTDSLVVGNSSAQTGGGVLSVFESRIDAVNCVFRDNAAGDIGGAMYTGAQSEAAVVNVTFAGNAAVIAGGAMFNFAESGAEVGNCVVWDNGPAPLVDLDSSSVVWHSNVQGGWGGAGGNNIDADPRFVAPAAGDYRLGSASPCIDAAINAAVPDGVTLDLDGLPRFVDDPMHDDCRQSPGACGDAPIVDMGAYERQDPSCPADLDASGAVDFEDVLLVLSAWGNDGGPEDLDADGHVGFFDLLIVLNAWGPCAGP